MIQPLELFVAQSPQAGVAPGAIIRHFSQAEAKALAEQWLEVYGCDRQGVNAKAYLWHIFAADRYPHVARDPAWAQYDSQEAVAFVVLANDRKQAFLTSLRPSSCHWVDYVVFPPNLAWTMARTHEEERLGPYFARHPRYVELAVENHAAVRKQREADVAKSKGWT